MIATAPHTYRTESEQETDSAFPSGFRETHSVCLDAIVHHREAVNADMTLEMVQGAFRERRVEYLAVVRHGRVVGLCARGRLAFVMSARFGFAIYSQHPVASVMTEDPILVVEGMPIRELLARVFDRQGDRFHEDVVLVDSAQRFVGMLNVESLARLQSRLVAEQLEELEWQQETLRQQNLELFRANHAARQSQALFTALFENHCLGAALLDSTGQLHQHNRRLAELLGEGAMTLSSGALVAAVGPEGRSEFLAMLRAHAEGAMRSATCELVIAVAGRGERRFRCSTGWVGEIGMVSACLEDVTEQRALEQNVLRQEKQSLLDTIVGGVAHELNNKLMPVIGFAELLGTEGRGVNREYLNIIMQSVGEAARIVRQLQELSRPPMPEIALLDLRAVVDETLLMLKFGLREARCQVRKVLPAQPVKVLADGAQMKQVLLNLVLNATHAIEDRERPELILEMRRRDGLVELIVGDNGCGIAASNLGRIFDPFFTTKGPKRGTGLGLSICAAIVRQHGGEIGVESTLGEGTRFSVRLPVAGECPETDSRPISDPRGTAAKVAGGRVLVVEDELVLRRLMQELLRARFGCHVDLAADGRDALRYLAGEPYDLIISDVRMPEMDGAELFRRVRELHPQYASRFVVVTGYPGENHVSEMLGGLNVPILAKPFTADQLAGICRSYLAPDGAA